jgi:hypothetical protein
VTTATNPQPNVALPAGAIDSESWAFWDNDFRTFHGADRFVLNGAGEVIAEVRTSGVQLPNGSVDNVEDAPTIDVCICDASDLSADQAQDVALALLNAAADVRRWVRG